MNKNLVWVIVTDGDHARIMERENHIGHLKCTQELSNPRESKSEHQDDRPGRAFESATTGSHAYEAKTNWTEYRKELFVRDLAALFTKEHQAKHFPKVCLITPPKLMSILRSSIHSYLDTIHETKRPKLVEIPKNLTHQSVKDIEILLKEEMI